MPDIQPPANDDLIERHQFYATLTGQVGRNSRDIDGIGKKIHSFTTQFDVVRDEVRNAGTRNKTIVASAIFLWSIIGGGVGIYITRALSSYDAMATKAEVTERKILAIEVTLDKYKDVPDKLDALRSSVKALQLKEEKVVK